MPNEAGSALQESPPQKLKESLGIAEVGDEVCAEGAFMGLSRMILHHHRRRELDHANLSERKMAKALEPKTLLKDALAEEFETTLITWH
jgi:hypothetical protein